MILLSFIVRIELFVTQINPNTIPELNIPSKYKTTTWYYCAKNLMFATRVDILTRLLVQGSYGA